MERIDDTGFGGYRIIQGDGFSYGVDSVLVSWFMAEHKPQAPDPSICDLGSGNGIIPLILCHKIKGCRVAGIEIDEDAADRAQRTVMMNGLSDRIRIMNADINDVIRSITDDPEASGIAGMFDAVVTNPPYFKKGAGLVNPSGPKAVARHELTAGLPEFLRLAELLLKKGGSFCMVHRPERLTDILSGMRAAGIEPKHLQFVVPRAGKAANMVLAHGVKGANPGLRMLPDIIVHGEGRTYTGEINRIY